MKRGGVIGQTAKRIYPGDQHLWTVAAIIPSTFVKNRQRQTMRHVTGCSKPIAALYMKKLLTYT